MTNFENAIVVNSKPTTESAEGLYKLVIDGIFYGYFMVSKTWTGEKAVQAWNY